MASCFAQLTSADVIAVSAASIALLAMGATFWQAWLARRHNRLSVRPHLDYVLDQYPDKPVTLIVVNNGLGPAIVRQMSIAMQGATYPLVDSVMPNPVFEELRRRDLRADYSIVSPNSPIAAGGRVTILTFPGTGGDPVVHNRAVDFMTRFGFSLEYQSMYGEKFSLNRAVDR